jgi:hypothetical protein
VFSECGTKNNKLVQEGTFPALVAALHQVWKSYFSVSKLASSYPYISM